MCGLEIRLSGSRVTGIRGDANDVLSRGFICPKGSTLGKLHDDPDRLRGPLVRRAGRHVEVSWSEAFAAVDEGLRTLRERHGADALAVYLGNPNVHNLGGAFFVRPLLQALRTRNLFSASTVDQMPRHVSCALMYGSPDSIPVPDLDRCEFLLMLGANPVESNGSLCTAPDFPGRLRALRARGGRLVVVDPRRTRTAQLADEHISIRPGSDAHWLLSIANVLFAERLVDLGRVADISNGLEAVRAAVAPFTPAATAERTGITADRTVQLARQLAAASSASVYGRIGVHTAEFGTLASWAADLVSALTGNLDRAGGLMFPLAAHMRPRRKRSGREFATGRWQSRVRGLPEVRSELPVAVLAEEIATPGEGRLRGLLTVGGNPALSIPGGEHLEQALASLEFMVSVDPYLNETTRHADVILPPPSALERSHYDVAFTTLSVRNVANYSPAIFEPHGPSESEILARLALIASGKGPDADPTLLHGLLVRGLIEREVADADSPISGRDPEEIEAAVAGRDAAEQILDVLIRTGPYGDGFGASSDGLSLATLEASPHGIDLGPLEPALPDALRTRSGAVELLPDAIAQDLARLRADLAAPAHPEPLRLIGRRRVRSNNSWMHNVDVLVRGRDLCTLVVHPRDAKRLGLVEGTLARVRSKAGSVEVPVELSDQIREGVVSLPHGYGHDRPGTRLSVASRKPGVNSNRLTDCSAIDPLSGNAVLNGIPVTVAAVAS
jgi:anaerobic selenocysteine-containing dehydrogenase